MGTKRRVATWYKRRKNEYVCTPPGWKPADGILCFSDKEQLLEFARAAKLILRDANKFGGINGKSV